MHRRSRKILIGIGVVVFVLGAIYAAALTKSTAKLRAAYAALEQDGRPMDPAEFIRPQIPEVENAAPLYEKAAAMLWEQPARRKNLLYHLGLYAPSYARDTLDPKESAEWTGLMDQDVVATALAIVEKAAQRPACRFDPDRDEPPPSSGKMSLIMQVRFLGRIWGAKACRVAKNGDPVGGWAMIRTSFRVAEALSDDLTMGARLQATGAVNDCCHFIQSLCEVMPPDVQTYREIEGTLRSLDDIAPLVRALDADRLLRGERLFNLPEGQLYAELRDGPYNLFGSGPEFFSRLSFRVIAFRPRLIADHATYLEYMLKSAHLLQGPYLPEGTPAREKVRSLPGRGILASQLAPMVLLAKLFHSGMAARLQVTRAGLALLQYRRTHGAFPPTLDDLDLEGLIDPFSQGPLLYRSEGEGFLVYSVDEDQKDNGGSPMQPRQKTDYDLVWRFPRAVAEAGGGNS